MKAIIQRRFSIQNVGNRTETSALKTGPIMQFCACTVLKRIKFPQYH